MNKDEFKDFAKKAGDKAAEFGKTAAEKTVEFGKAVADKTGDAIDIGKLKLKISQEQKQIEEDKLRLGDYYYKKIQEGMEADAEAKAIADDIKACEKAIEELNAQISAIKED